MRELWETNDKVIYCSKGFFFNSSDKATDESSTTELTGSQWGCCRRERVAVGDLLCAGCESCSYDPVVNILDKSVSHNQAWIQLELPNDLLVQSAFFFFLVCSDFSLP